MKKIILSVALLGLMSCGGGAPKEISKVKCDTVKVAMYDSVGNETMVKTLKCDTVKENK